MGVPRIIRRVEAAQRNEKRCGRVAAGITKAPKKKRADKLRALAGAFTEEAQQGNAKPMDALETKYQLHEKIGQGKQGVVVLRCTERTSGESFAVKRVPRSQLGHSHGDEQPFLEALQGAAQGTSQLVSVREVIQSEHSIDLVMELASGGDLFEWVARHGALPEDRARAVFAGILGGLEQVHAAGFVHRDIKLENVLLMTPEPSAPHHVRLADFEFCTRANPSARGALGSVAYAAPEALVPEAEYTGAVDVWAAGVSLFALLSAEAPFDSPDGPDATAARIRDAESGLGDLLESPAWGAVSPAAKDLLRGLLEPNPARRLSLGAALAHPWLAGATSVGHRAEPEPRKPRSPKFQLRCTWHTKTKRWGHHAAAAGQAEGTHDMLVDEPEASAPLCPLPAEWAPIALPRPRANSL